MAKTAAIAGASGLIGGYCLNILRVDDAYSRVIVLARRTLGLAAAPKIEEHVVDFDDLRPADLAGVDDVFCSLGTTIKKAGSQAAFRKVDFEAILNLARASVEAGAKRFVLVSSVGADPESSNFYLRVKGETERAVAALGFNVVHIMRPSLLLGPRQESRTGESFAQAIMPMLNWAMIGPLRKYKAIPAQKVATAMVSAAGSLETGIKVYEYPDIVALANATDR